MKKIRRLHLYLGCFFTPLLFLYIFTGFMLTREIGTPKGENDAVTFMQKLSSIHMRQFYPRRREQPDIPELKSADPETDILTIVKPLQYTNDTPVKLTGLDLPKGLYNNATYLIQAKSPKTLTLHKNEGNKTPIDILRSQIDDDIQLNPDDDASHNATRIVGFDPEADTVTTETPHHYPDGLEISRISGIGRPPGLKDLHTYYTRTVDEKTLTLHESPDDTTPVNLQAFTYNYKDVFLQPTVHLGYIKDGFPWFTWLVYAMTLGVLITMILGVVLALRTVKNKWPVLASLVAGFLLPIVFLWVGIRLDTIAEEPSTAPETPAKTEPVTDKDKTKPKDLPKKFPGELPKDFSKELPKDLPKSLPKSLPDFPPGKKFP